MITALPPATGLLPVFLLLVGSRSFQTGSNMAKRELSEENIGYRTEFGFACKLLLDQLRGETDSRMYFVHAFDSQFGLARLASKYYPSLGVDPEDENTFLVFVDCPIEGQISLRPSPYSYSSVSCTIGETKQVKGACAGTVSFNPYPQAKKCLCDCLEAWQRWDVIQPADAISNTEPPTDRFLVTLKDLNLFLNSIKAATLKKDKRVEWPVAENAPKGKQHSFDYLKVRNAIQNSGRTDKEYLLSRLPESVSEARRNLQALPRQSV